MCFNTCMKKSYIEVNMQLLFIKINVLKHISGMETSQIRQRLVDGSPGNPKSSF